MAFCTVQFFSESIQKHSQMNVLLPNAGKGPFPVLYLLHGLSDDHTIWCRLTAIERHVLDLPLIVVMPDGHRSFYCNDPRPWGHAYEDHIVRDVVGFVDRTFPTVARRGGRAIGGLSMGGYGSMMLALRHPDVFSVVGSHSSAFFFAREPLSTHPDVNAYADLLPRGKYDCFALARKLKRSKKRLAIRFDCGVEDFLLPCNRAFHEHLQKLGLKHEYAEFPGEHRWAYWDEHVQQTIAFAMKHLKA